MRIIGNSIIFNLILLVSLLSSSWAEEENSREIDKSEMPMAVMEAFTEDYPEMEITSVEMWESDGVSYYELECGSGNFDVIYMADGAIYATEEKIEVDALPQAVLSSLEKSFPDGEIEEAEKISRGDTTEYEVVVLFEDDEEELAFDVVLAGDGKITQEKAISEEDDDMGESPSMGEDEDGD
jgi:hypothetical protein